MKTKYYRIISDQLKDHFLHFKQALILLGARQVGKTTLLKHLFPNALYLLVDEKEVADLLESYNSSYYRQVIKDHKQVMIDEIHLLSNPGRAIKLIYDQFPGTQLIITGSSSLHIKNKTAESMAGRAIDYHLYPLTFWEMLFQLDYEKDTQPEFILNNLLNQDQSPKIKLYPKEKILFETLKYGLYPEVINLTKKADYLRNLANKAIFKDIIELQLIENRDKALELLKVLAYQVGNIISYAEISSKIGLSIPTVIRYINIFEQSFLLYRLYPFSQKKRDEIGKSPKIYFWDLGIRNALIGNFDDIHLRPDAGAMFENFIISEIKKELAYLKSDLKVNYWRTRSGAEVDLVISGQQKLIGVEIKFHKGQITPAFSNRYPEAETMVVTTDNFF